MIPANALYVATADFNGDDRPDLIFNSATGISVMMNDGSGAFGAPVSQYTGTVRGRIHTDDFDIDGNADFLFAASTALVVATGAGDGTFDAQVNSQVDIAATHLAVARFDQDNTPDVAAIDTALAQLVVYTSNGSGGLQEASRQSIEAGALSMMAADMDADGSVDVVIGYPDSDYRIHYGNGNGTVGTPVRIRGAAYRPHALRAAHADSNGLLDIFVVTDSYASILRNLGSRNYGDPASYSVSHQGLDIEVGNLNGDADIDALTVNRDCSVRTWTGSGLGTFRHGRLFRHRNSCWSNTTGDAALGDFDGDGRTDFVTLPILPPVPGTYPTPVEGLQVYRNRCGDGLLVVTADTPVINPGGTITLRAEMQPPVDDFSSPYFFGTGTATLQKGGADVETVQFTQGTGKFPLTGLPVGTHTYTVRYNGDAQFEPVPASDPVAVRVTNDTTTTAITIEPNPAQWGTSPVVKVNITSSTGSTPTGNIEAKINGTQVCYGCAAPTPSFSAWNHDDIGTYTVTVRFLGDADHPPSESQATYTVVKKTPSLVIGHDSVVAGKPFQMSVRVSDYYSVQGSVTVFNGETQLATATYPPNGGSSGWFYLQIPGLSQGYQTLRVTYSGDAQHTAAERLHSIQVLPDVASYIDARGTSAGIVVSSITTNLTGHRKQAGQPWGTGYNCCWSHVWQDTNAAPATIYLYRLQNYDATQTSNVDLAQRISFTDDPLIASTTIRSLHLQEIVAGMNALRSAAGLTAVPSNGYAAGIVISASGINVLRNAINEARTTLGAAPYTFTATIAAGDVVRASHIQELREAIR